MKKSFFLGILMAAISIQAETFSFRNGENSYMGADDTYIRLSAPTTKNGAVGLVYMRNDNIHGLFRFDLADLKGVVDTVTNATLTLRDFSTDTGYSVATMHRILKPWSEADITYNEYASGLAWETAGAMGATDRSPALSTNNLPLGASTGVTYTINIPIALVQDWIENPQNNNGILLHSSTSKTTSLRSSEHTVITERPKLTINATVKPTETFTFRDGVDGYTGTDDTYIRASSATNNYGTAVGLYMRSDNIHGLFKFNLASLANKRVAEVASATVTFFDASGEPVNTNLTTLHRLLQNWQENEVTYNQYASGSNWQTNGAVGATDRGPTLTTVGLMLGTGTNFNINLPPSLVEDWIAHPSTNYGFMLDPSGGSTILLGSCEHSILHKRPLLTINVVRDPPIGTLIRIN